MDVILDTCAFLFLCLDDPKLSAKAKQVIIDPSNRCLLSIASVWEIAIKTNAGKLEIDQPFDDFVPYHLTAYDLELIPIEIEHLSRVATFQQEHRDPFDRLIIAQGLVLSMPIVTKDSVFEGFGVKVIW